MFVDSMWMQRGLDALTATLDVDDATKHDMIQFLFDEGFWDKDKLKWQAALSRFNDCLNPGRTSNFRIAEIWALMKRFRRFQLLAEMAEDCGFHPLRERPTEERRQELLRRIADAEERLLVEIRSAKADLASLDAPIPAPRIHPAIREGGSFAQPDDDGTIPGGF